MLPIMMLRGFNSRFYYVEKVSASSDDQVVKEVKAKVINYNWSLANQTTEVKKLNEG